MTTGLAIPPLEPGLAKGSLRDRGFERFRIAGGEIQAQGQLEIFEKGDCPGSGMPVLETRGQVFETTHAVRAGRFPRGVPCLESLWRATWMSRTEDRSEVKASGAYARRLPLPDVPLAAELRGAFRPTIGKGDEWGDLALVERPPFGEFRQTDMGGSTRN